MEKQWEKKIYPFKKTTKKKYQVQSLERHEISPAFKNIANCKRLVPKIGKGEKDI